MKNKHYKIIRIYDPDEEQLRIWLQKNIKIFKGQRRISMLNYLFKYVKSISCSLEYHEYHKYNLF